MDALIIERIWEDVDFYEISINVKGLDISVKIPAYINDEMIMDLSKGMSDVGTGKVDEFNWECGQDIDNVTSYAAMKIYKLNIRGIMCIEFILDNKLEKPYWKRTEFSILTEANSLIEFSRKIKTFVNNNLQRIEGIYLTS